MKKKKKLIQAVRVDSEIRILMKKRIIFNTLFFCIFINDQMMHEGGIMAVLDQNEINEQLHNIKGWKFENDQIGKEFELRDFKSALEFVNKVGAEAELMDHHPDILMHSWNKVKISVSTHSEGGVTEKDFKLAGKIEGINN